MNTTKYCAGCRDNCYNLQDFGANMDTGRPRCWSLDGAVLVWARDVPIDQRPPYTMPRTRRPSCYRRKGYTRVLDKHLDAAGYWR